MHAFQKNLFGRRVGEIRGSRIPVIVVTGFLGAGKTTLLNHFLRSPEGANSLVVVNEFGEVPVDHDLLKEASEDVVLLGNGCLCCSVRSDLELTLRRLYIERSRSEIPFFQRVVIETSGMADPGPILRSFLTDRALGENFHIEAVVAVVDAATALSTLARETEPALQLAVADRIVISKSDLVPPADLAPVLDAVKRINGSAPVVIADHGRVPPPFLLEATGAAELSQRVQRSLSCTSHTGDIETFSLHWENPFSWPALKETFGLLTALRGRDILRVKGFAALVECQGPVVIHVVQHLFHPPAELKAWPDEDHRSRFVFITRNLPIAEIEALFDAVAKIAAPTDPSDRRETSADQ